MHIPISMPMPIPTLRGECSTFQHLHPGLRKSNKVIKMWVNVILSRLFHEGTKVCHPTRTMSYGMSLVYKYRELAIKTHHLPTTLVPQDTGHRRYMSSDSYNNIRNISSQTDIVESRGSIVPCQSCPVAKSGQEERSVLTTMTKLSSKEW